MPWQSPLVVFLVGVISSIVYLGIHHVDEGHVGVYWRGGALLDRVESPGMHWKAPFFDSFENVQVTFQTDSVRNIPCGTSGGVVLSFDRIEVVNRLRADRAHDTVKQYGVEYDKMWVFDKSTLPP